MHQDILAADLLDLIDLRNACPCHDVHPGVFHHLGAMPADALGNIQPQKACIGLVEVGHCAGGIGHHGTVVDAVEDQLKQLQPASNLQTAVVLLIGHAPRLLYGNSKTHIVSN